MAVANKDARIMIERDPDAESPREWCNLGAMVCRHSRYALGDKDAELPTHELMTDAALEEAFRTGASGTIEREAREYADEWDCSLADAIRDLYDDPMEYPEWLQSALPIVALPLYLYDHSGITMSTSAFSCPWDSGQVGIIWVSLARVQDEYGSTDSDAIERAAACLRAEVENYDLFITGNVFGFTLEGVGPDGADADDSCWGFFVGNGDDTLGGMIDHLPEWAHDAAREAFDSVGDWVDVED